MLISGLEDNEISSAEEAFEFTLQSESSSCEDEQEDIWFDFFFYFISFEVLKIRCFDAKKLLYFGSNKKSIPLLNLTGYRPTQKYAHQKRPFSRYKPWAYIRDLKVM